MKVNLEDLFIKSQKNVWLLEDAFQLSCEELAKDKCFKEKDQCVDSDCAQCWREHFIELVKKD